MAGGQQVWVTWSGSKLLHKSRLKVDLLGGAISLKRKESRAGSAGLKLTGLAARFGLSPGAGTAPCRPPLPDDAGSWHVSVLSCGGPPSVLPHLEKHSDPSIQIGPGPYVTER